MTSKSVNDKLNGAWIGKKMWVKFGSSYLLFLGVLFGEKCWYFENKFRFYEKFPKTWWAPSRWSLLFISSIIISLVLPLSWVARKENINSGGHAGTGVDIEIWEIIRCSSVILLSSLWNIFYKALKYFRLFWNIFSLSLPASQPWSVSVESPLLLSREM